MTNGQIIKYNHEIQTWKQNDSVIVLLMRESINAFYSRYRKKIDTIKAQSNLIRSEYVVMKGGQFQVDKENKPILKQGKTFEEYKCKMDAYMSLESTLIYAHG